MRIWIVLIFLSLSARAESVCSGLMAGGGDSPMTAYLYALLEERILSTQDLSILAKGENPLAASTSTARKIHARELDAFLSVANRAELNEWIERTLARRSAKQIERNLVEQKTHYRQMNFVRFETRYNDDRQRLYNFEIMDTAVTQSMWHELMGENPSHFKLNGHAQPEHPVERVTWFSAATFANQLSEKNGLRPFYDFSRVKLIGRAELGELKADAANTLDEVWNHMPEDVKARESEGYRLATYAETEAIEDDALFGSGGHVLSQFAWYAMNSEGKTHAVAGRFPQTSPIAEVYDYYGNVSEWMNRWSNLRGGVVAGTFGGAFDSEDPYMERDRNRDPSTQYPNVGFRLVRTVK